MKKITHIKDVENVYFACNNAENSLTNGQKNFPINNPVTFLLSHRIRST